MYSWQSVHLCYNTVVKDDFKETKYNRRVCFDLFHTVPNPPIDERSHIFLIEMTSPAWNKKVIIFLRFRFLDLKLEVYSLFIYSRPEVGKLARFYFITFLIKCAVGIPFEGGGLQFFFAFYFSWLEAGNLFWIWKCTMFYLFHFYHP